MSFVVVLDGATVTKDPVDQRFFRMDWDTENLATGIEIDTSGFSLFLKKGRRSDPALDFDNAALVLVAGKKRQTQLRLLGGTIGQEWEVSNTITTNESPTQRKKKSFRVLIEDE